LSETSQRKVLGNLQEYLAAIGDREWSDEEYFAVYNLIDALAASGRTELLSEATHKFAPIVARSKNPLWRKAAEAWLAGAGNSTAPE